MLDLSLPWRRDMVEDSMYYTGSNIRNPSKSANSQEGKGRD